MRYAIYFSPAPGSPLTAAASQWLGRDAFTGNFVGPPRSLSLPRHQWQELVAEPQRYGFHATLKAPFELRDGWNEADLITAFERFSGSAMPFEIPRVVLGRLGPFFALVPDALHPPLQDFAASVVEFFEPFRAPLADSDIARRRPERLSEGQRHNLTTWGYPYVMEEFRFHMTLTGPVENDLAPRVREELEQRFASHLETPLQLDGLALFIEKRRGEPFTVHRWQPLGVPSSDRKILP